MRKSLCGSQQTGKFFKRSDYQTTWPASWEIFMQVKKKQLELDMKQQAGFKLGKEYIKAVYCHLTYMRSASCKMPGWMKHKLESRLLGEISITSDMQMTPPLCRKQRGTKKPIDESERGERNSWLKTQHSKNKDQGIWSHHFMANRWGNGKQWQTLFWGALKSQPWN